MTWTKIVKTPSPLPTSKEIQDAGATYGSIWTDENDQAWVLEYTPAIGAIWVKKGAAVFQYRRVERP